MTTGDVMRGDETQEKATPQTEARELVRLRNPAGTEGAWWRGPPHLPGTCGAPGKTKPSGHIRPSGALLTQTSAANS